MRREGKIAIGESDVLFLIDLLNAFNRDGELPVNGVDDEMSPDEQIELILLVMKLPWGLIVFTGDEHPADHIEHEIYGKHSMAGTKSAEMVEKIREAFDALPDERKLWYAKGQDRRLVGYSIAYSIYYGELIERLRKKYKRLYFCGRAYTQCVGESAIDAKGQLSFEVFVIRNLSLSLPPPIGDIERMDKLLDGMKIEQIDHDDLK